ncbi:hypothetical protein [Pontibacillus sp. HMF3514]|uniref:hypothetical protein n=1 Tax=Pontibacillus sp. HMF3514 TaxID=2692425 RepID=UPI00131F674E|nr:hypothetical protein [Pontibacillus sp. HMF3514]QHE51590.1 hypothetical protein GS400_05865 [Pontibacillus sp. HMF3514]
MNRKSLIIVSSIIIMIGFFIINSSLKYLYNPFTYPDGLISEYDDYSYRTFKKPIVLIIRKFDLTEDETTLYSVKDIDTVKNILEQFDNAEKLSSVDHYPFESREEAGARYDVSVLQRDKGHLIPFSFFENSHMFDLSPTLYYKLDENFKEDLLNIASKKNKVEVETLNELFN